MAAEIRSEVVAPVAKPQVDNASRDDLAVNDVVELTAIGGGTTFQWTLVFVPEGSGAVLIPPADVTTAGPLQFTVDLVGPYLVRLTVDAGQPTESTQYVRLRALTSSLGLHLVSAGERRDSSGVIPVDVDIEGWANEQNSNLLALETAAATDPLADVLVVGNTTGGTNILMTTGDEIVGQTHVVLTSTGAATNIVLNPDAAGSVVVNGKLTVTGLIDPTGVIFDEAASPTVVGTKGGLFVSDGTGALTQNHLYYQPTAAAPPVDLSHAHAVDTERYIAFGVEVGDLSGTSPDTFNATTLVPDGARVTEMSVLVSTVWDGGGMAAEVGDGATADRYMAAGDSSAALLGRYLVTLWDQNTSGGGLPATLTLTYSSIGTTGGLTVIAKYVENPAS